MQTILVRLGINAAALWVAAAVVSGIELNKGGGDGRGSVGDRLLILAIVAAIFGVVNTVIKPVVQLFSLPLFILTLGLIIFVINALMLMLTSAICDGMDVPFHVDGFGPALLGGLVVSMVSILLSVLLPDGD